MKTRPPCSHSFVVSLEVMLLTCVFITTSVVSQDTIPQEFLTVAEKSDFKATSRSAEVEAFLAACADRADHVHKTAIGNTVEDRPIVAAIVANPPVQAAQDLEGEIERLTDQRAAIADGAEQPLQQIADLKTA